MGASYRAYSGWGIAIVQSSLEGILEGDQDEKGCGHSQAKGQNFCPKCGAKVEEGFDSEAAAADLIYHLEKSSLDVTTIAYEDHFDGSDATHFIGHLVGKETDDNGGFDIVLLKDMPNPDEIRLRIKDEIIAALKETGLDPELIDEIYDPETDFGFVTALEVSC